MAIQPADGKERLFFLHLLALSGGFVGGNEKMKCFHSANLALHPRNLAPLILLPADTYKQNMRSINEKSAQLKDRKQHGQTQKVKKQSSGTTGN